MELFDKLLISRMFCYFQGLWATPKHQKNLFKLSTKCFVIKWNNFEGWDLRNFRFLKNHHFKSHPILHSMHKIESRETSNRKYLSKTILACRERQANNNYHGPLYIESPATIHPLVAASPPEVTSHKWREWHPPPPLAHNVLLYFSPYLICVLHNKKYVFIVLTIRLADT